MLCGKVSMGWEVRATSCRREVAQMVTRGRKGWGERREEDIRRRVTAIVGIAR